MKHSCFKLILSSCLISLISVFSVTAMEEEGLEYLLFEEIPSMITKVSKKEYIPASVTTITEEQIQQSPARNIYDLIETYVPGSFWMNHHEAPHFGIRGIISDRNYKFLLLINGRKINQNAHSGAEAELENWDMNDIERIEIVRGPGSIIYGPGAIEGVVNIITKSAATSEGLKTGAEYVSEYDSKGAYISYGKKTDNLNLFLYGSVTDTDGIDPDEYWVNNDNEYGYMGSGQLTNYPASEYFDDTDGDPQLKFQATLELFQEWKAWARYSNSGTSRHANDGYQTLMNYGFDTLKQNTDQLFLISLENVHSLKDNLELKTSLSYSNLDHERRSFGGDLVNKVTIRNMNHDFSEEELLFKLILNYTSDFMKIAGGVTYSKMSFGPGWGDSKDDMRMGDSSDIFGSVAGALAAGKTSGYYVYDGWNSYMLSYLGEANFNFNPKLQLLLSGRVDDHEFADAEFSPRIAIISDWDDLGVFKLIGYQSIRMSTEEQLKLAEETGGKTDPESLKGFEFIYNKPIEKFNFSSSIFYTETEIVGWATKRIVGTFSYGDSTLLGNLDLWGIELEGKYETDTMTFGVNHSYTKQKDFELESGQVSSGISYADYNRDLGGGVLLTGTGNDLNNWANHVTKIFLDYKITEVDTIHLDAQIFWEYEGAKDGLDMLYNAVQGTSSEAEAEASIAALKSKDVYETNYNVNVSYTHQFMENLSLNIFVINLFEEYKRYSYDAGLAKPAPYRTMWIEEPRAFGAKIDYRF